MEALKRVSRSFSASELILSGLQAQPGLSCKLYLSRSGPDACTAYLDLHVSNLKKHIGRIAHFHYPLSVGMIAALEDVVKSASIEFKACSKCAVEINLEAAGQRRTSKLYQVEHEFFVPNTQS